MIQIQKHPFTSGCLRAPLGKVLLVAQQHGGELPTLWLEVESDAPEATYCVRGTGQTWNDERAEHVGSAVCGAFVWHVYREPQP